VSSFASIGFERLILYHKGAPSIFLFYLTFHFSEEKFTLAVTVPAQTVTSESQSTDSPHQLRKAVHDNIFEVMHKYL
jgi:hypothetical protein